MTKFNNATFSVGGKCCAGCDQRDVWLKQKDEEIERLYELNKKLTSTLAMRNREQAFNGIENISMRGL